MYAISFDLDTSTFEKMRKEDADKFGDLPTIQTAYRRIQEFLEQHGFKKKQYSLYYGGSDSTDEATREIVAEMIQSLWWVEPAIRDIRLLKIPPNDNLQSSLAEGIKRHQKWLEAHRMRRTMPGKT